MGKYIIAITGASGSICGIKLLEALHQANLETILVVSHAAESVIKQETIYTLSKIKKLATHCYSETDLFAPINSGSYAVNIAAMCIVPCSMKTLAAVANGYSDNLITRAADVCIKENKRLILAPRETPFSAIHLQNMLTLARLGAVVMPPLPAFYAGVSSVDDIVRQFVGRILDQLGLPNDMVDRWGQNRED